RHLSLLDSPRGYLGRRSAHKLGGDPLTNWAIFPSVFPSLSATLRAEGKKIEPISSSLACEEDWLKIPANCCQTNGCLHLRQRRRKRDYYGSIPSDVSAENTLQC